MGNYSHWLRGYADPRGKGESEPAYSAFYFYYYPIYFAVNAHSAQRFCGGLHRLEPLGGQPRGGPLSFLFCLLLLLRGPGYCQCLHRGALRRPGCDPRLRRCVPQFALGSALRRPGCDPCLRRSASLIFWFLGLDAVGWVVGSVVVVFLGSTGLCSGGELLGCRVFSWTKNLRVALGGRLWAWPSREAAGLFGGYEC